MVDKFFSKKNISIYAIITIIGIVTRFYGLGEGSIIKDEMFTAMYFEERYMSSLTTPLYYILVKLITEIFGVTRWSLRLPAAVLGVISIPAFYYMVKRVVGPRAALIGSLFLIFNPWHLHYSQNARFYSGVLLFGLVSYLLFYYALQKDSYWLVGGSLLSNAVAFLFHPTAVFIAASCGVYAAVIVLWGGREKIGISRSVAKVYLISSVVIGLAITPLLVDIIFDWLNEYARALSDSEESLTLSLITSSVFEAVRLLYRVSEKTGFVISFASLLGLWVAFRDNFYRGLFFVSSIGVPFVIIVVLSKLLPAVRPRYVFYVIPMIVICAAVLSSGWHEISNYGSIAKVSLTSVLIVSMLPAFISHYTAQSSLQVEDAVDVIENRYSSGDLVVAHERDAIYRISAHHSNLELERAWGEDWKKKAQKVSREGNRVWFIMNSSCVPGVLNELESWLIDHASLVWRRHRKGFVHGLTGYEVWVMEAK